MSRVLFASIACVCIVVKIGVINSSGNKHELINSDKLSHASCEKRKENIDCAV